MTEVRDPVHGYVKLEGLALEIANTPQMQRLRWIKQLGLANLVYPGANHTRFEHSLGAYHMAFTSPITSAWMRMIACLWALPPSCTT